ncbi:MAG: cation transporter, partial [Niameybacter sp.]
MKYLFRIEGIDCANCAAKIERALNKDELFKEAYINFMLKKVEVHTEEKDPSLVEEKIKKIASRVEDGVVITAFDVPSIQPTYRQETETTCGCGEHHHQEEKEAGCGCGGQHHQEEKEAECGCGGHHHQEEKEAGCGCGGHHHQEEKE